MSEKELIYSKDLTAFRDDLIKVRVSFGNRIGAKKDKNNGWVFLRRYTVCKNKHANFATKRISKETNAPSAANR